jgi:hypothetical protein
MAMGNPHKYIRPNRSLRNKMLGNRSYNKSAINFMLLDLSSHYLTFYNRDTTAES